MKIYLFNQIDEDKLLSVMDEMELLGAPTVFYISHNGNNFALFGSHRLTAAYRKGIKPFFAKIPYSQTVHADMSLKQFAEYWRCFNENMLDANSEFPICPSMREIANPNRCFFGNSYRPFLDFGK
jgi:hypothetical protein